MLKTTTTVSIMKNRQELQLKEKDLCSLNEVCLTNCITHNAEVHNAGSTQLLHRLCKLYSLTLTILNLSSMKGGETAQN